MRRSGPQFLTLVLLCAQVDARQQLQLCGTTSETSAETLFLHRQSMRARSRAGLLPRLLATPAPSANRDMGDIAIIEDADGVIARQNEFSLDQKSLQFNPTGPDAARYRYAVADQGYDAAAAEAGAPIAALDDDDARAVTLPWAFPFFGANYTRVFVNSDGNLTFTASDTASTDRSLGRMTSGPPRIAPLFDDLDPSRSASGVRVLADATRFVVSWSEVPEWRESGIGARQTFQVKLYPDGRIEFSYSGISAANAVVGIAPGGLEGGTALVDFRNDASGEYAGAVAERFGNTLSIDIVTVAQKFYETHEDSYDYLVIYNNMNIEAAPGAVAYESTVRSIGTGFGVAPGDDGRLFGSQSRLKAMLNLGPLNQYPADPDAFVPRRASAGDTPLTTLGHEAGHLFLARASVRDPNDPTARPMLGFQSAHWSFVFNSEASLMEGERILDRGPQASPRFVTTDTVQAFSPLDQYLMGFRAPNDVFDTFLVTGAPAFLQQQHPLRGYEFDGQRRDVTIGEIVQTMGRRTPDSTVAQRRFRFAFILIVPPGSEPSAADFAKLEGFRSRFETFFGDAAAGNAAAQTSLRRAMKISLSPSAGIVAGATSTAILTVQTPPGAALAVQFQTSSGNAKFPDSVTIPAGVRTATFTYSGIAPGVEEVAAMPADPAYETAFARVQVAGTGVLKLTAVSGDRQVVQSAGPLPEPVVVRLTDENGLIYSGARIVAAVPAPGSVTPPVAITSAEGLASFTWSPGPAASNELQLSVEAFPEVGLAVRAGSSVPVAAAVVNAASFENGIAAGAIGTIFGANLTGGRVLLNGRAASVLYGSGRQINFYVPADAPLGTATLSVVTGSGTEARANVTVAAFQPGIFAGGVSSTVRAGEIVEIYCTGLGPTRLVNGFQQTIVAPMVFLGAAAMQPVYSGLAPGYSGLYQVNVRVPADLAAGTQRLVLTINQLRSNEISIAVQ